MCHVTRRHYVGIAKNTLYMCVQLRPMYYIKMYIMSVVVYLTLLRDIPYKRHIIPVLVKKNLIL